MKISSSIMCWNESKTIDLALKSLVGFADEVMVTDTGSIDGTQKLAEEWMQILDLSGEVRTIKPKGGDDLMNVRLAAWMACSGDWVLMHDAQLVLSNALKDEMKHHAKNYGKYSLDVKSLNLMGDYEHFFSNRQFMAYHRIFSQRNHEYEFAYKTRPHFIGAHRPATHHAFNLSRVRPAWRSWYRGEPFDRRSYKTGQKVGAGNYNRQYQWLKTSEDQSLIEHTERTEGLSLEDVREIAPSWYLRQLQTEATPLPPSLRSTLAEVLKKELENPRYKLEKSNGEIYGRWPEL